MQIKLKEYYDEAKQTIKYWNNVERGTGEIMCDALAQLEQHAKAGRNEADIRIQCPETFWVKDSLTGNIRLNESYLKVKNHLQEKFNIEMYFVLERYDANSINLVNFKWSDY